MKEHGSTPGKAIPDNLNRYFDSTLLKPEATERQIENLCREAIADDFFAVCVNPFYVQTAKAALSKYKGVSNVKIATVAGFPLGAATTKVKVSESDEALKNGADEIDMVINLGLLKDKKYAEVSRDISAVVEVASNYDAIVKVILETCLLSDEETVKACILSRDSGAAFVKTSTGFSTAGATVHAVGLMKQTVGDTMKIKASGGIRNLETALKMIDAGADRLGCSSCTAIMRELSSCR